VFIDRQPMGRLGTPEEIASMCICLAGDKSSYVTGQTFNIDGGTMIRRRHPFCPGPTLGQGCWRIPAHPAGSPTCDAQNMTGCLLFFHNYFNDA